MAQNSSHITLSEEHTIAWLQHHVQVMHGYALALTLQAGLSPAEAAAAFVEPWHGDRAALHSQATLQVLEQQVQQIAQVLALTYGAEHVHVQHQDDIWRVHVTDIDPEPLERYGASMELYSQWIAEQLRHVCEPKGIRCSVWLEEETQSLHVSLALD